MYPYLIAWKLWVALMEVNYQLLRNDIRMKKALRSTSTTLVLLLSPPNVIPPTKQITIHAAREPLIDKQSTFPVSLFLERLKSHAIEKV